MSDKELPPAPPPYEVYRAQRANEARMQAAEMEMDETVPGGRYKDGDQWVDANGKPIKDAEKAESDRPASAKAR